jgi:dipeptidyl-peptidase-4
MHFDPLMNFFRCCLGSFLCFLGSSVFLYAGEMDVDPSLPPVRGLIEAYREDAGVLERFHPWSMSEARHMRTQALHASFDGALKTIAFDGLSREEKIDYLLFQNQLVFDGRQLDRLRDRHLEVLPWVPFGEVILDLFEARQRVEPIQPETMATTLDQLKQAVQRHRKELRAQLEAHPDLISPTLAGRVAQWVETYQNALRDWYRFYDGYHPSFSWWVKAPYQSVDKELEGFADFVRKEIAGYVEGEAPPLLGDPIGRGALMEALEYEMVAYSPEELIEIAYQEFEWCDRERKRAARDLGFGDDWRAAYDYVKTKYVPPGEQPQLIKKLAHEAIDFLEARDLLTIPSLAKEVWRMHMMTPERQKVNPYFTGGEVISVSYPTDTMEHSEKLMSMRGNNVHFSKATVHHELIPGHHLQLFMADRYRTHRQLFRTPFLVEGWALYWEMLLWNMGFHESPEDRIGMLFWRSHRCARIIFSLSFHLGRMSAHEAIDFLVENVGHERRNATAEVRRSIQGGYIPLYQAAYMLGGLQIRSLYGELVEDGDMPARAFHDAILRENAIPIDMIRASLKKTELSNDYKTDWRFYHDESIESGSHQTDIVPEGSPSSVEEALAVGGKFRGKVTRDSVEPHWFRKGERFWYQRKLSDGKSVFQVVDATSGIQGPAFDHELVAKAMSELIGSSVQAERLPVERIVFDEGSDRIRLEGRDASWLWNPKYTHLIKVEQPQQANHERDTNLNRERGARGRRPGGDMSSSSPDGTWKVSVKEHNLWLTDTASGESFALSYDGNPGDSYQPTAERARFVGMQYEREEPEQGVPQVYWSPDSRWLVAIRFEPGIERHVHLVESSPKDQLQPKLHSYSYLKPGDKMPVEKPALFDLENRKEVPLDDTLYANPWSISRFRWDEDSERFTFLFNQRGHQLLRIVAVEPASGQVSALLEEASNTFVDYAYKNHFRMMESSNEILWMSERDGWNHLYLFDAATGYMKHQVTGGDWVVRRVDRVDEEKRQIWFQASGMDPSQDPYYIHYCRVNFDGTGLVRLTQSNGTHSVEYSPDGRFLIDTWSRVDLAPVTELRDAVSGKLIVEIERAETSKLEASGWQRPEPFQAKGRDGVTDIYGVIYRPTDFDPTKSYPVIEKIYAGPHGSFVPKEFRAYHGAQSMAELGFIVVQIDGMGTSNRSKAFHDVCWQNIGDAGFPDRIAWMRAAAEKYPYMDLERVGIYGGSAGGQNTLRGLLAHGDFYKVGVADCGCHDNRMDKIWWNELWMGWPVGAHYDEQSNVTQAHKLKGNLLLLLGEMDRNVDPASTMQVVNALIKADKPFDMLVMPGVGHGAAGTPYGRKRMAQYFIDHL